MLCQYCNAVTYSETPKCTLTDDYCFAVRRCQNLHCWLPTETANISMEDCRIKKGGTNMNKYKYKIRFMKYDTLYVEYEDTVIVIANPFGDKIPSGINEIVKIDDVYYVKGYEPKVEKKGKNCKQKFITAEK
ncbi:MAG: hypothetical protein RSD67_02500 [Oscillospiraceae bacterium]